MQKSKGTCAWQAKLWNVWLFLGARQIPSEQDLRYGDEWTDVIVITSKPLSLLVSVNVKRKYSSPFHKPEF